MSLLNIACPTCGAAFNNADDLYSTSCGHLFHYVCLTDWQSRRSSCPQCAHHNPLTHKLYLSFDGTDDDFVNIEEMKQKLKSSLDKIIELGVQNSEKEVDFMKLQEQYTTADKKRKILQENLKRMKESEEHFKQMQGQYTESTDYVKYLEDRLNQLSIENEQKSNELQSTMAQNKSLKAGQGARQKIMQDSTLNQKIKILEQKFKNITTELEKEINTSTQLSIEKMKLESLIKNMNVVDKNQQMSSESNSAKQNFKQTRKNQTERNFLSPLSQNQGERNRCIVIKDLPANLIITPLEMVVVNLASMLRMSISADDLVKVHLMDEDQSNLVAEFKSSDLKEKFLAKKIFLKNYPLAKMLRIREFMPENIYELYKYAKERLESNGYICVFCANNQIFAKKLKEERMGMRIRSKQQVDKLCRENTVKETADTTKTQNSDRTI